MRGTLDEGAHSGFQAHTNGPGSAAPLPPPSLLWLPWAPPPPQDPSPIATQEMRKGSGGVPGGTSGRPSLHSSPEPSSLIFTVLSALESLTSFAALTFSPSTSRGSPPPSELLSVRKGVGTKLKKKRKKAPSPQHHTYRRRQRKGSPGPGSPWTSKLSMG